MAAVNCTNHTALNGPVGPSMINFSSTAAVSECDGSGTTNDDASASIAAHCGDCNDDRNAARSANHTHA